METMQAALVDDYVLTLNEVNATTNDVWNYAYPYGYLKLMKLI